MKRLHAILLTLLLLLTLTSPAYGQGATSKLRSAGTLPATCDAGSATTAADIVVVSHIANLCIATNTWAAIGGSGGGTGAGPATLDCSAYIGADLGATLNSCITALPSTGGIADARGLAATETLSTAVSTVKNVTILLCGQQITQTASITLSSSSSNAGSLVGCPSQSTKLTKGANLTYQVEIDGFSGGVQYMSLDGASGSSFSGSGILMTANSASSYFANNFIVNEQSDCYQDLGAFYSTIYNDNCQNWGNSAYATAGNITLDTSFAEGFGGGALVAVSGSGNVILQNCVFLDDGTLGLVQNAGSSANVQQSFLEQVNGYPAITGNSTLYVVDSGVDGGGAHGATVVQTGSGTTQIANSNLGSLSASDVIDAQGAFVNIVDNNIALVYSGASGLAAIKVIGAVNAATIRANKITIGGTSPSGDNYGIWVNAGATGIADAVLDGNFLFGSGNTTDVGIHYDDSDTSLDTKYNQFINNHCELLDRCIVSSPTTTEVNYYRDNFGSIAVATLYSGIGAKEIVSGPLNIALCGTTTSCANTFQQDARFRFGTVPLTSGTPSTATITGLPFASSSSYVCWATDETNTNTLKIVNASGASTVITGPNTNTDTIGYGCAGQ